MSDGGLIWIVDDSAVEAQIAQRALTSYETRLFTDGSVLIETLSAGATPDVLILDWQMPGLSGIEVCRFLREQLATMELPILLLTGFQQTDDVVHGLEAGANDYVTKPFSSPELVARVDALVRSRRLRLRAERAEADLGRLLEELPEALLVVDQAHHVSLVNKHAEEIFGRSRAELIGRPISSLLPDLERLEPDFPNTLFRDVEVGDRTFAPALRRIQMGDAPPSGLVTLRDVTEKRRHETRRLDFYSIIAHDLRSPLSAMHLRTQLMLGGSRGALPPAVAVDLGKLSVRIEEMSALINDFLELARIEGVGVLIEPEPFDLVELVRAIVEDLLVSAEARRLAIRLLPSPGDVLLVGDRRRIGQVLTNLLSNAIKFSREDGEISIDWVVQSDSVEVSVRDQGRGIAPEPLARLFRRYERGAQGSTDVGGTGLGLMIVREIVEAHSGTVGAESQLGLGSRFWFRVPTKSVP